MGLRSAFEGRAYDVGGEDAGLQQRNPSQSKKCSPRRQKKIK